MDSLSAKSLIRRFDCFLCFLQLHDGQALFQTFQPECCLHVFRFIHYAFFSVCLYLCLFVCLFVRLFICMCDCLFAHLLICLFVSLSFISSLANVVHYGIFSVCLFVCPSIISSLQMLSAMHFICLSVCPSIISSLQMLSAVHFLCPSAFLSVCCFILKNVALYLS
jgi:hypothetical protein